MSTHPFNLQPTLADETILLRPLKEEDFDDLYAVASDPLIWEQHPAKDRCQKDVFQLFFKEAMDRGGAFAVIDKKTGTIIGSTRFNPVPETNNAIEIGWTFLARAYWGRSYNTAMKRLLLNYAFQFVEHVLFYINENNFRSQKAVEKIGGERITDLEGVPVAPRPPSGVIYAIHRK